MCGWRAGLCHGDAHVIVIAAGGVFEFIDLKICVPAAAPFFVSVRVCLFYFIRGLSL